VTENEPGGLAAALEIERRYPPEKWADRVAAVPEPQREVAAEYLRDMYRRLMVVRKLKRAEEG
jgi:hypothetical protein